MPPDHPRLPARKPNPDDGMSDEEREFLRDFARNGIASRRVWKVIVIACGGVAAVAGAVVAVISLARAIGPSH